MPKRDSIISVKFTDNESMTLRKLSYEMDMDVSELIRACIAIGLPAIQHVEFVRRVRLEDNKSFKKAQ